MTLVTVLLFASMFHHKPKPTIEQRVFEKQILDGHSLVAGISEKMPLWDADSISRFETVQIATVKADIAMALDAKTDEQFLKDVKKLNEDWDLLCGFDTVLKQEELI